MLMNEQWKTEDFELPSEKINAFLRLNYKSLFLLADFFGGALMKHANRKINYIIG